MQIDKLVQYLNHNINLLGIELINLREELYKRRNICETDEEKEFLDDKIKELSKILKTHFCIGEL